MRPATLQSAEMLLETRGDVIKRGHKDGKVSSGMRVHSDELG
jgi:hypothetical protein